ncbi:MAG: nickel insertion protein, partial [Acidimicrobiales bacterium]
MITADAGSRRLAWFNCALAGIAGDMALGALVDAGADATELCRMLERLPLGGWRLEFEACQRASLAATRAVVSTSGDGIIRTFSHIAGLIEEARFPERVADRALSAFSALAEAEGRLHRRPPSQVHFHEVGGH